MLYVPCAILLKCITLFQLYLILEPNFPHYRLIYWISIYYLDIAIAKYTIKMLQSCQFFPSTPQAKSLNLGGFLKFNEITGCPHEATAMMFPQVCCNEAATIILPSLLLNYIGYHCFWLHDFLRSSSI